MKNKIIFFLFLAVSFFINPGYSSAKFLAPYLDVTVTVETVGASGAFDYSFDVSTPPSALANYQESFSLQTASGTASHFISTASGAGDRVSLSQKPLVGWTVAINCSSNNNLVTFDYQANSVLITTYPFSSLTCTFTNTKVVEKTPVVIIPGVLSSYLNRNDEAKTELWPNIFRAIFGWPGDRYLDQLALNQIGQPNMSYPIMLPTDIFRKIGDKDFFDGLIKKLIASGYEENKNLFVFPYDWRLDVRLSVDNLYSPLLTTLKAKVEQIQTQTGSNKVDLVAHSLGGLLAKYYIKNYGSGQVNKFIDLGTPHLGAPSAFKTLMYGDDMGIKFGWLGLNSGEIKKISQNMVSAYQLLPSQNYFSTSSPDYKYYVYNLDFAQTNQLLKNAGRNDFILDTATNIHNDLDFMNPADYGVQAYNIVGCGIPTIGKFFILGEKWGNKSYDVSYIFGDGSVPERSARSFPAIEEYQVTGVNHSALPSSEGVSDLVSKLLANNVSAFDFTTYEYVSTSTPVCKVPDGSLLSFHGPVKVDIYDSNGNHTGPTADNYYEQNIPGVYYDFIDENIFIFINKLIDLKIIAAPIASTTDTNRRPVSIHTKKIENNNIVSTSYYNNIPLLTASTTIEVKVNEPEIQVISGVVIPPSTTIAGDSLEDQTAPVTSVNLVQATTTNTVEINFSTEENDTLETEYSPDGGANYNLATSTVVISNVGTTTITYYSTDQAGNIETPKQIEVVVDPVIVPEIVVEEEKKIVAESHTDSHSSSHKAPISKEPIALFSLATTGLSIPAVPVNLVSYDPVDQINKVTVKETIPEPVNEPQAYYATAVTTNSIPPNFLWLLIIILLLILLLLYLGKKSLKR